MKKMFGMMLAGLFVSGAVAAQQIVKAERVGDFMSAVFSGKISVELIPADENTVSIELHDTDISRLDWGVSNGTLSVKLKPGGGSSSAGSASVKVYYRTLDNLSLNGAEAITQGALTAEILTIDLTAGAKLTAAVQATDFTMRVANNSVAQLNGAAKYLTVRVAMKSKADLRKLDAVSAEAVATSNSELYVKASERLVADASISSTIFYLSNPPILKKTEKMGGTVHNISAAQ